MVANVTTPLIGVVSTTAIGRLDDAALLGGVAMASIIFDCLFWLFSFLRMSTLAFTAQSLGAGETRELTAILVRGFIVAGLIGSALIALQVPLAAALFDLMGGSEQVTRAAKTYFMIRIWSAPLALGNYVILGWLVGQARANPALALQIVINVINMAATILLVLVFDAGAAGAAIAAVLAETTGFLLGLIVCRRHAAGGFAVPRARLFDRARLMRMLSVNSDIMIRTAALITAFLFFTAKGARAGDVTLAANAVLNNFLLVSAFFLDGLANAAQQLCGRSFGARDARGFAFGVAASILFMLAGRPMIDLMTASADVRSVARQFLWLAALAPVCGVMAFCFDGIYVGATWARDMRNLMLAALAAYFAAWWLLEPLGNAGLWIAFLVFFLARGGLQATRYPALLKRPFA
jgi:MATE family multidrug resistance protein